VREINTIILHCSATSNEDSSIDAATIKKWHLSQAWKDIGYHWVVLRSGVVEKGRLEATIGAHCLKYNTDSIGICLIGMDKFTPFQYSSLLNLLQRIMDDYSIGVDQVKGHYEFTNLKSCPNLDMTLVREWLYASV